MCAIIFNTRLSAETQTASLQSCLEEEKALLKEEAVKRTTSRRFRLVVELVELGMRHEKLNPFSRLGCSTVVSSGGVLGD
jgi:DNA primase large subunit